MLAIASRLGPYEIVAPLGAGGMGEVYRARDTRLGREVAIKVLPERFANDPNRLSRFEREVKAVAALSHPNILAIHDYGKQGAITYAVMELLEGETLRARLAHGLLPWREAVEIGAAIADGLAAAHAKGIVHRDLKPENLFLTADGRVKVLDFGLARVSPVPGPQSETGPYISAETEAGAVMGTVGYMSPEQVRGQSADVPSDLFSFGCVLYEMVTGRRAFQRETAAETMTAILHDEPSDASKFGHPIPAELDRLVRHCLAKPANQRLQSARDLSLGLRATTTAPALHRPAVSRRPRKPIVVGILAALVLLGALGVPAYFLARGGKPADSGSPPGPTEAVDAIAVLPFENVGDDPKTEYLSDTIADHLINSFSQLRRQDLKVRPFDSVARYKRQRPDVVTMGRELNAQMIVMGKLHLREDDLSIRVALVDARDNHQLWGDEYQGKLNGIMSLQDRIARDVAAKLRLGLTPEEDQRLTKRHTADPEAYLLYREGVFHWSKFRKESIETAIEYYQRALKKDPNYALAYAGLGRCYSLLGALYTDPLQNYAEARKYLTEALSIDNSLEFAHAGLGTIAMYRDWDWQEAERELRKGYAHDSTAPAENHYGFFLAAMGRPGDALVYIRRAQAANPSAQRRSELAMCYNWMGQYNQAVIEARKALEVDPIFPVAYVELGTALVQQKRFEEAIAEMQKALDRGQKQPTISGILGCAYALAGKKAEAHKVLEDLKELSKGKFRFAFSIARIYAALGEKDLAIEWLRKSCAERDSRVIWIKVDPTLESLRLDPRFAQLLAEMRLPP